MHHRPNYKRQNSKLLENTVEKLHDLGYGDAFIDTVHERNNWTSLKLKMSSWGKIILRKLEDRPKIGRKYLQKMHLISDWYPKL